MTKAGEHRDSHEFNGNPIILGSFDEKIRREMVFEDTFEEQLLWLASFDEYRDEGGAMNAWLKLALAKSESVLSGDVIDDFTPYGG